ncbi:hypothetical protein [Paenibacillus qinlingensis]|uniref:hypothetical protein n=1 Tax=Paenibacillus qinlingensis TaxID=1837343 RepID=UPI0015649612|nr:hypothetical protein [Paenibacillus qinlingensis]NQX63754.1 hypothetical protein [Paenibacillus qinlingensis]
MKQRSFKLANTAERPKFWATGQQPLSPSETNPVLLSNKEKFNNIEGTAVTNSLNTEDGQKLNAEIPKLRKAIPVKSSAATKSPEHDSRPKPVLKPKTKQTEQVEENQNRSHPIPTEDLNSPSKRLKPKAAPFGDRYERITTYLEKPLFQRVHNLHERGEIAKIASLLNAAVKEYLDQHYPTA